MSDQAPRLCGFCGKPIPLWKRVDAQTCSKRCAKARWHMRQSKVKE